MIDHAKNVQEMRDLLATLPPFKQQQAQRIRAELLDIIAEGQEVAIITMGLVVAEIMAAEDSITLEDGGFTL